MGSEVGDFDPERISPSCNMSSEAETFDNPSDLHNVPRSSSNINSVFQHNLTHRQQYE